MNLDQQHLRATQQCDLCNRKGPARSVLWRRLKTALWGPKLFHFFYPVLVGFQCTSFIFFVQFFSFYGCDYTPLNHLYLKATNCVQYLR